MSREPSEIDPYLASGNLHSTASGRLSYLLGLRGASLSVDTACSSTLTALHLAHESIASGECRAALVGGVNLDLHPTKYRITRDGGMLAKDGRCRAFGEGGTGYVAGEGVGAVFVPEEPAPAAAWVWVWARV